MSKEDLIEYVLKEDFFNVKNKIIKLLEKNNGNIFEMSYEYLDHTVEEEKSRTNYYLHVSEFLKENNIWLFDLLDVEEIKKYLDLTILNFTSNYDLKILLRVIAMGLQITKMDILNDFISKEEGLKRFKRELIILKRGALKEENL